MPDYLTNLSPLEKFLKAREFLNAVVENPDFYGLRQEIIDELTAETDVLDSDITAHVAAKAEARSRRLAKDSQTKKVDKLLRKATRWVRAAAAENKEINLAALGIGRSKLSVSVQPATVPVGSVDTSQRFQHTINYTDQAALGLKRKPRGTLGCDIYLKIGGEPPVDEKECVLLTVSPKSFYVAIFEGEDVGKTAHYMLRWRLRDGTVGAWGKTLSATITG